MFAVDTENNEIYIYDDIGPAWFGMIDAGMVREALAEIGSENRVTVRLNTPGGSVDEGVAIFNMLRRHKGGVDTVVDSLAASMGSYLMIAGENRTIADNARVMVHHPWTIAIGNAAELREVAGVLDKYSESLAPHYAEATGRNADEVEAWLAGETWFTADEAIEAGFATIKEGEAVEPVPIAEGRFKNTPKGLLGKVPERTPYPVKRERARQLCR